VPVTTSPPVVAPAAGPSEPIARTGASMTPAAFVDTKTTPGARRSRPESPPTATVAGFSNLKLLVQADGKTSDRDVVLNLTTRQLSILPPNGGGPILSIPYAQLLKATYVRGRAPQWDATLSAPFDKIDPGFRARHWLVLQTAETHAILRLDGGWQRILEALEAVTARRVDRPLDAPK
jgi:hypothetical protein